MTVIATAVAPPTPTPTPGVVGGLTAVPDFAAVLDMEMAVDRYANPKMIMNTDVIGKNVVAPITAGTTRVTDAAVALEDAVAPNLSNTIDPVVCVDGQSGTVQPQNLVVDLLLPAMPAPSQLVTVPAVSTNGPDDEGNPLLDSNAAKRTKLIMTKSPLVTGRSRTSGQVAEPIVTGRTSPIIVAAEVTPIEAQHEISLRPDPFAAAVEIGRPAPMVASIPNTPVEQLLAALSHGSPAERQWLDTVIRDVANVAEKSGDVRFRVEPEGYGRITIERTADRLEISVMEPRAMVVADAARPQVVAGAAALGVPVSGATVVLDQSGQRSREDARQRQQIEHRDADKEDEAHLSDIGRYA